MGWKGIPQISRILVVPNLGGILNVGGTKSCRILGCQRHQTLETSQISDTKSWRLLGCQRSDCQRQKHQLKITKCDLPRLLWPSGRKIKCFDGWEREEEEGMEVHAPVPQSLSVNSLQEESTWKYLVSCCLVAHLLWTIQICHPTDHSGCGQLLLSAGG